MSRALRLGIMAAAVAAFTAGPSLAQSAGSGSDQSGTTRPTDQQGSTPGAGAADATKKADAAREQANRKDAKASSSDRAFVVEAAAGGMAEVELGRLASEKAASDQVKQFGRMMVTDHSKANEKLAAIASDLQLMAPHALKPEHQEAVDRLSKLSGEAFDRAYVQQMVKDHEKDVDLFKKHAASAEHPDIRQFASSTLPTLERHYARAQQLQQEVVRGTSGTEPSKPKTATDSDEPKSGTSSGASDKTPPPPPQR
jgi:putative membrane protein